eukprot:s3326_g2.t1
MEKVPDQELLSIEVSAPEASEHILLDGTTALVVSRLRPGQLHALRLDTLGVFVEEFGIPLLPVVKEFWVLADDERAPEIFMQAPVHQGEASSNGNITLFFSEALQADMSGIINISDGLREELIPLSADSQMKGQGYVILRGSMVIINPSLDFSAGRAVTVNFDPDIFKDLVRETQGNQRGYGRFPILYRMELELFTIRQVSSTEACPPPGNLQTPTIYANIVTARTSTCSANNATAPEYEPILRRQAGNDDNSSQVLPESSASNKLQPSKAMEVHDQLHLTNQHSHFPTIPHTGGIPGFETNKRRKTQSASTGIVNNTDLPQLQQAWPTNLNNTPTQKPAAAHQQNSLPSTQGMPFNDLSQPSLRDAGDQHRAISPPPQSQSHQLFSSQSDRDSIQPQLEPTTPKVHQTNQAPQAFEAKHTLECHRDDEDSSWQTRHTSEGSDTEQTNIHESNLSISEETKALDAQKGATSTLPSRVEETMVIFVKHEESKHPMSYTVTKDMTAGRLTLAEAKLGTFALPVTPRSLVGTHVPLDAEMHSNQYVILHQKMPPSLRCPHASSKFSNQVQGIDLGLPCTRFEALWRQQAWVANDEMDYYLDAVQLEDKALPFPTATFYSEAEASEWAHEWLAMAIDTDVTEKPWCSAAIVGAHWIPMVIRHNHDVIQINTTPEGSCFVDQITQLAQQKGKTVELHQRMLPQAFLSDCGFQSLSWIIALVNDIQVEPLPPSKASQWRHLFVRELSRTSRGFDLIHQLHIGGSMPESVDPVLTPRQPASEAQLSSYSFAQIEVRTVGQNFKLHGQVGIGILDTLKLLTAGSIPTIRAVTVEDEHSRQTPLPDDRQLSSEGIVLFVDSPSQLLLSEQDVVASDWPIVAVLHSYGILVLKRQPRLMCFDVEKAVEQFDFEWEAPLLDYTGARLIEDTMAPNIVFLGVTAKTLDFWELLRSPVAFRELAQGYVARIPQNQVHAFIHWIEKTGIHALIRSCGWQFLSQLNLEPLTVPLEVYLLPRSDRLAAAPRAICQLVIQRIFINQVKFHVTNPMLGSMVRVSLKLWRTWIWTGQVGSGENTQFIHHAWQLAHQFFGDSTPIRLITFGNQINPEWPISHYTQTTQDGEQLMKIHVVLQLHGGGPPEPPPRSIHEAYSFQELEDLEQADVNRLISVLIQNLMDVPADEQHIDLAILRSSTLRQDGPSFTMVGSVSTVVRLMRDLSTTGIEALLRAMGWVTAMSISDCREPVQVQLHLMPRAGVRHLSQTTVQSFMAHALTIRAMPIPYGIEGGILVKVKLADSWVLVGRFPPEVRMAIFIDSWYQATSFFGRPSRLRIICNSAQANPDRSLAEYARTNELGEQYAKLFLVLQLHGGGPKVPEVASPDDHDDEEPFATILLTVPGERDQRLLRLHTTTCIRAAFAHIRPEANILEWRPVDSFGYPLDWDMSILGLACIHFTPIQESQDEPNGLQYLLNNHCETSLSETEFHLRLQANESQYRPIAPICVTETKGSHVRNQRLRQWIEGLLEHAMASSRPVASLCLVDQHWIPFVAHVSFDILQVQTTTAGMDLLPHIERCCRRPHQHMPHSPPLWLRLPVNFLTRQCQAIFPDDCGYQGIIWLMNHICTRRPVEPLSFSEALQWRDRYLQHLACWDSQVLFQKAESLHLGGAESDAQDQASDSHHLGLPNEQKKRRVVDSAGVHEGIFSCLKIWDTTAVHAQTIPSHEELGMYDAWIGARLCTKSHDQLRNMPAPNPICKDQLEAVREELMNKDHRLQLLQNQNELWADDELAYHLQAIANMTGSEQTIEILDPLVARAWSVQDTQIPMSFEHQVNRVVTVLHHEHHWTPLIFVKHGSFLNVHTWACTKPLPPIFEKFALLIQGLMHCSAHRWILYHTRLTPKNACGVLAIALVGHVVLQLPLPQNNKEVSCLDNMLRKRFARNLPVFCTIPHLWASGHDHKTADEIQSDKTDNRSFPDHEHASQIHPLVGTFPCTRIEVLRRQGPWVATDEMDFYLDTLRQEQRMHPFPTIAFPPDCDTGHWGYKWITDAIQTYLLDKPICSAAIVGHHWIPIVIRQSPHVIHLHTTNEGRCLTQLLNWHAQIRGKGVEVHLTQLPHVFLADCGFQVYAWIRTQLSKHPQQAMSVTQAGECRKLFAQYLFRTNLHTRIIVHLSVGGAKLDSDMMQGLVSLLRDHGVWPERAADRASKIADVIPPATIKSILSSRKSWADLKHAANQAKPPMKLILQDELDAQIAARAKHRTQFGRKPAKPQFRQAEVSKDHLKLTASDLQVPVGVFKQQDGVSLGPLQADQVGNNAEGVVLIDEHEAQAMLKLPTPVTHKGLAVLVLATKENAQLHETDPIRFPALCLSTQEPLIASGYLYQLGSIKVERQEPSVKLAVDERATEAIRCLVFRDQTTFWDAMQTHPVKTIFSNEPLLQQDSQSEPVVIDVWDRQWVTKRFEKTKAASAELFAFSFRMLAEKSNELISKSGTNGTYYEPRSACGRYPSDTHHVTWLPGTKFQEAKYAQQTSPQVTSLVRHADRYGLRSDTLNAQQIHEKHRPDTPLLLGSSKMLYMLGPLPYSTTKEAVTKLLKAWGWEARPLQPRGRSQDGSGVTWCIQATADPSHWIYVLQHGDVLISKLQEDKPNDAAQAFSIVASRKTMWHLHNNADTDPLQVNDPWKPKVGGAKPVNASPSPTTNMHPATLANMEATLEKRILANITQKMPSLEDVPMESIDSRVSQLESQIAQIQHHQQTVDSKLTQVDQSMQHVQTTQQGIESSVNQMQQQMEHQNVHLAQTIDRKMLGEAINPGPHIFGNANTTGLMGKSANLAALGKSSATFAVQETHLTAQGISRFRKEMIWQKTKFTMTHGAPAPPKNNSLRTLGGKHTGVAFLSTHPIRSLAHHWTKEDYETGRCLATAAYIDRHWVTMGTVYGFNEGAHSIEVQQHTDRLLSGLTSRIVDGSQGLRMISGDWNLDRTLIPQADYWESKGWIEAQQLAHRLWNRSIMCTCKRTTVKDFLYLSPEMVPYVEDVQLDWNHFADHATILVFLRDFDKPPKLPMWRKPKPLQWVKHPQNCADWQCEVLPNTDTDRWYQDLWEDMEKYADHLHRHANMPVAAPYQKGRAGTKEVVWTTQQIAPVKPNRRGDIQSELACTNLTHSRWTKQIRRLQHYARAASSQRCQISLTEHRSNLWRKVRNAAGFQGGFTIWWNQLDKAFKASPPVLPIIPPESETALCIFEEFSAHYRKLEASLTKTRFEHAKQRRTKDPLLIYRDLQKDRAEPVQTLVQKVTLPIQQSTVVDSITTLTFAEPLPESIQTVTVNQIPVHVQQTGAKEVTLDTAVANQLEGQLSIHRNVGDIPSILEAFEAEWKARWQKHDDVDPTHWDPAIEFFKTALPPRQVEFPPITIEQWRKTVSRKKRGAAIGPDGVSRHDLLAMPDSILHQMLQLIHAIEAGSDWPSQAVTGLVAALAKKPTAATVGDFRPICIFSLFYRTWSTLRGKQCLQYLQSIVPQTLLGNIPGRSPKKLWFHVQQCIEHAYGSTDEIAGTVIDLVKCFNTLPRKVLQDLASHIGIPWTVVGPWLKALQQMTRRFQVRGATGKPLLSTTGYPEGCALSVVAMAICNLGLEVYMFHRYPRVQTWSFVDNIELLAKSATDAIAACEGLSSFCELLDLQIDDGKSYLWCNTPSGRKLITTSGQNRKFYARDLGGHLNYTKISSNATIQDKIADFAPFWSRLARSCAPIAQKERSLYVCAWPNLFYGISTVVLGTNHFLKLRTLATKALNLHQMGSTPSLQLSCLSNPFCDPEFYCVHATITSFRDYVTFDLAEHTLQKILETGQTTPGPCKSFLQAIHKLGWRWHNSDRLSDQDQLPIHVLRCPKTELTERIMVAWQQRILSQVAMERTTMGGLFNMDAKLTRQLMAKQPQEHQGLLRCALNGTQYTQDALYYAGKVDSPACKFCGQPDSLEHRNLKCPFFSDIRKQFPEASMPPDVSPATACHGWIPKAAHQHEFRRQLLDIPDTTNNFMPFELSLELEFADIFLDGSCVRPHDSTTRLATWGMVIWNGNNFCSLSCGGVQGLRQTSLRAEICAAISALKFLANQTLPVRLWIDNKQVFIMLDSWAKGTFPDFAHKRDSDLWYLLLTQFQQSASQVSGVFKVQAHLKVDEQTSEVDAWAVQGNAAADACASAARVTLPFALLRAESDFLQEMIELKAFGKALHTMIIAIGLRALDVQCLQAPLPSPEGIPTSVQSHTLDAGLLQLADCTADTFPKKFRIQVLPAILRWIPTLTSEGNPIWISFHQLLADFQHHSKLWGPASTGPKWIDPVEGRLYSHKHYVQWFSRYLQGLAKAVQVPLTVQQRRPNSHVLAFWCGTICAKLTTERLQSIDDYFKEHALSLPARQIERDLGSTPPRAGNPFPGLTGEEYVFHTAPARFRKMAAYLQYPNFREPRFSPREGALFHFVNGSLLLFSGIADGLCLADTWVSRTGEEWTQVPGVESQSHSKLFPLVAHSPSAVDKEGCIWVLGGQCNNDPGTIWKTCNVGRSWFPLPRPTPIPFRGQVPAMFPMAFRDHAMTILGGWQLVVVDASPGSSQAVWRFNSYSAEFVQRVAGETPLPFGLRREAKLLATSEGGLYLVGGHFCEGDDWMCNFNDVWFSGDTGESWHCKTKNYLAKDPSVMEWPGVGRGFNAVITQDDTIFVLAGDLPGREEASAHVYESFHGLGDVYLTDSPYFIMPGSTLLGQAAVPPRQGFTLFFGEEILLAEGAMAFFHQQDGNYTDLENETNYTTGPIVESDIMVHGKDLHLQPREWLLPGRTYRLEIPAGHVKDVAGNPFGQIWDERFEVAVLEDNEAPRAVSMYPPDGRTDVEPWTRLALTMSEEVVLGHGSLKVAPVVGYGVTVELPVAKATVVMRKVVFQLPPQRRFTPDMEPWGIEAPLQGWPFPQLH